MPDENQNPTTGQTVNEVAGVAETGATVDPNADNGTAVRHPAAGDENSPTEVKADTKPAAKHKPKAKDASADEVVFLSRLDHLVIDIGDQKVVFNGGKTVVSKDIAPRLKRHHLSEHGHIFDGREFVRVGNEFVELSRESASVQEALKAGGKGGMIFCFPEAPNGTINLGDEEVRFHNGKAVVKDKALAERLERHMFFVQGRMTKLEA